MFQNITDNSQNDENEKTSIKRKIDIRSLLNINDIVIYILSFMISTVSFNSEFAPFGLAIFAAACSNKLALGFIYIMVVLGTLIKFGISGLGMFLITSIILIAMILIFRPIEEDDRNEVLPVGKYLLISTFLVQVVKIFIKGFLIYDLLSAVVFSIITYIFYKIFANSLVVIKKYRINKAFSIEEIMGAFLLISIAFCSFSKLTFFGLSLTNILSIMLVLFMGWKHGMLVGATTGITIGMVLGIISRTSPILIAAYAISGLISGILNRFGKIGVIIGFFVGNAVLTYISNGNTIPIILAREILIASLGLLILPKNININIEDIIGKNKYLPTTVGVLDGEKEATKNKLNSVSETISEMARSYNEAAEEAILADEDLEEDAKNSFKEELLNNIEDYPDNILYEDIIMNDDRVIDEVFDFLEQEKEITSEKFLEIFNKNNNYILGIDSNDKEVKEKIEDDIKEIVKTINATYRINKLNIIWKQKEASNKKVLANQLGGVSKVISSIAEDIEMEEEPELKQERYSVEVAKATKTKNKSEISGDNNAITRLKDGKFMIAISDGMGSGEKANKSSKTVIQMLEKMLTTGFDKDVSIGLINSAIKLNSNEETYATIDISVVDLAKGNIEFIKNGACPTFIKSNNKVEVVKAVSFPAGMLDKIDLVVYDKDLKQNDIIIMCSDGILEANQELENKELWLKDLIEQIETQDVQKIANIIMGEAIDLNLGIAKDDMTVIVAKLTEKN